MSNWGTSPTFDDLLPKGERMMSYQQALAEAMEIALASDERVRLLGEGVTDKAGTYGTTCNLHHRFGDERVFDVPIAEGVITGTGIGMSLAGLRPIVIHPRNDFLLVALDQICNHAAKWELMFGRQQAVAMAIRTVSCRGWGSAAQHSQAIHSTLAQFPGLEIAVPATPADAKGMLLYAALQAERPVMLMEHKWLWKLEGHVDEGITITPPSAPQVLREGKDITIVGVSYGTVDSLIAARRLNESAGIDAEVIDVRYLRPMDVGPIAASVEKTGRLIIVDTGHVMFGVSAEIICQTIERIGPGKLLAAPIRIGTPDSPVPACSERTYFPSPDDIVSAVKKIL